MINKFTGKYRFLSNFYPVKIKHDGLTYPSVEHYFQANKTLNMTKRKEIAAAKSAAIAKKMGRNLTLRKDWEIIKDTVMLHGVFLKFSNTDLQNKLKETYPHELIEENTWGDTYWGVCGGIGKNMLGKILMIVRFTSLSF